MAGCVSVVAVCFLASEWTRDVKWQWFVRVCFVKKVLAGPLALPGAGVPPGFPLSPSREN